MEPRKFVAPEFILGRGALDLAGQYAANLGGHKVLVVSDPGVVAAGWVDRVEKSLGRAGLEPVVFTEVTPDPKDTEVMAGAALYEREACDMIVAVGGGSPMDCAKGVGVVVSNHIPILAAGGVDRIELPCPPLICIPTTAGSAADISQFAIITDHVRKIKVAIISKIVVPDVALIDPLTTLSLSRVLTADSGMDALVHAVEAYVSTAKSPMTDLHAMEAIRLISRNLKGAIEEPGNLRFRDAMMLASLLAGLAFSNASLGLAHAMAHSLGGTLDLPHGECTSLLLEHVARFNFEAVPGRYLKIARTFGLELSGLPYEEQKARVVEMFREFRAGVGLFNGVKKNGLGPADFHNMARAALQDACIVTNPVQPTEGEIVAIYERVFR
ncbi:MAG: alcohol dehydrogenase-like regulatory protein ErcA [Chthoniobacteraceae bacterium]